MRRLQKWLVRGAVIAVFLLFGVGVTFVLRWTDPAAVREEVLQQLQRQLPGAQITLQDARLRLFGGVLLSDLRITRRDDPHHREVIYVPSAVVHYDREQLFRGKILVRSIELYRPRVHIIRRKDATWNISELTRIEEPAGPLPAIVVYDGSLHFEDKFKCPSLPALEVNGLSLTVVQDSDAVVQIGGKGKSGELGEIEFTVETDRRDGTFKSKITGYEGKLDAVLWKRLVALAQVGEFGEAEVRGNLSFEIDLIYSWKRKTPVEYTAVARVNNGFCSHPRLPFPLHKVAAEVGIDPQWVNIRQFAAESGPTRVNGHGRVSVRDWANDFSASVRFEHLQITDRLCSCLPDEVRSLQQMFKPRGQVSASLSIAKERGRWTESRCTLRPEGVEVVFAHFPYPVANVRGKIEIDVIAEKTTVNVHARDGDGSATLTGTWLGQGPRSVVNLRLNARNVAIDERILRALPAEQRELVESFNATGRVDVTGSIDYQPGWEDFRTAFDIVVHDATANWDRFPYPLDNVRGKLKMAPESWQFDDFVGEHGKGRIAVRGSAQILGTKGTEWELDLEVKGTDLPIDESLRRALSSQPRILQTWDHLAPAGVLSFEARYRYSPLTKDEISLAAHVRQGRIRPLAFPYELTDLSGSLYYRDARLELVGFSARHGNSRFRLSRGIIDIAPDGGYYADLRELEGSPVYPNDGFIANLPSDLRQVAAVLDSAKPIAFRSHVIVSHAAESSQVPDVWWDGKLWIKDATLNLGVPLRRATGIVAAVGRCDAGRLTALRGNVVLQHAELFGQPFHNATAKLLVNPKTPESLYVNVRAPIFGGDISGEIRLDFLSNVHYELNLTASHINLAKFGRHNFGAQYPMAGLATGRLYLTGKNSDLQSLEGEGSIDLPEGRLLNAPPLLDLLKFLGLRWPDQTVFDEAHASFRITGRRVRVKKLELWGSAISLFGSGEFNIDGTDVRLDLYPSWARIEQVLPPGIKELSPTISKNLLQIEARGRFSAREGTLRFHKKPVPILVDPLRELHRRITRWEPGLRSAPRRKGP